MCTGLVLTFLFMLKMQQKNICVECGHRYEQSL
jgi:hypothetical protein